jgi:hypothetical protein
VILLIFLFSSHLSNAHSAPRKYTINLFLKYNSSLNRN